MAIQKWQPGTLYIAGTLVVPTIVPGATPTPIANAAFDSGDSDWTKGTGWAINTNYAFSGTYSAEYSGPGAADLISTVKHAVSPGKAITATCFVHQGASGDGEANAAVGLFWYDSLDALISTSLGNSVSSGEVGTWYKSTVSGTAPPLAAKVSIGCSSYNDWAVLNVDNFAWNYITGAAATGLAYKASGNVTDVGTGATYGPATDINFETFSGAAGIRTATANWAGLGFIAGYGHKITVVGSTSNDGDYDAVSVGSKVIATVQSVVTEAAGASITVTQPGAPGGGSVTNGTSGATEPIWPLEIGGTVLDGTVTWEAVATDSVTWEASSVLTSGSSEPTWPTTPNSFIFDNNIAWETVPLRITDEKCPHSKVVAIAASKVFAGDTDVVRFSATLNARDWSSEDDAGFLPSGLQQKSQVGVDAMGVYRGNLAVWSASTFQVWQVDPDPATMAMLDAMEGIGTVHQQAVQPVSDDLFFLAALGVRTVAIAEGTNNLASGDVGVPIDTLIQAEANAVDVEPVASYYPGAGQYWLAFRPLTIAATLLAGQFLLTSPPYPIEATDELYWGARVLGGTADWVTTESMEFSATPLNSEMESILQSTGVLSESMEFSATPQDSDLDVILLSTGVVAEDMEFSATPQDGTLDTALVSHTQEEEGIDWTAIVTGGDIT